MSTQEERRRQIGVQNTSARTQSGYDLRGDLNRLVDDVKPVVKLEKIPARGPMPAARGLASYQTQSASGLASPLTEIGDGASHSSREYYEDQVVHFYSSDYLLAVEIKPLKTLRMVDADGSEATFEFNLPPLSEEP